MESSTLLKDLKISPRKLRFLLPAVKKLTPKNSLEFLYYIHSKPAQIFYRAIQSALSNAKNYLKTDEGSLIFKHLSVEEGHKIKRYHAGGRGTARAFYRRYSHIHIILEAKKVEKVIEPAKKQPET